MIIQICIHVTQNKRYWVNIVSVKKISFILNIFLFIMLIHNKFKVLS